MKDRRINIMGVEVDNISRSDAKTRVGKLLDEGQRGWIATPNPEIVLRAKSFGNEKLRRFINSSFLSLPDGVGLKIAAFFLGQKLKNRVAGADFMLDLARLAEMRRLSAFILGGSSDELAKKAAADLLIKYPALNIAGALSGGTISRKKGEWSSLDSALLGKINKTKPDIIFVGFGCPKQEYWLDDNFQKLSTVKIAMTVGGGVDFLAGKIRRAPTFFRGAGLEWLWRLMIEPSRFSRIWDAVFVFPIEVIKWRIRMHTKYRKNVAGFIVNKEKKVLLVHRANEKEEHWQIPQGGVDPNESEKEAVLREMREETGLLNLKILGTYPEKYSYRWSEWHSLNGGYLGQKQTIFFLYHGDSPDAVKTNPDEISAFKWEKIDNAVASVHQRRKEMVAMAIKEYQSKYAKKI